MQDLRNAGSSNGKPSVLLIINRQPGANIIETVDRVRELLPQLRASIPSAIDLDVVMERTTTIRASLRDVERTLLISIVLVILVVFVFLRNGRATLIPSVAVPVSLIGTFGVMYLCGFSLEQPVADGADHRDRLRRRRRDRRPQLVRLVLLYYDPARGLLHGGAWTAQPPGCSVPQGDVWMTCNDYDVLNSEPRIASYLGIAAGQVPAASTTSTSRAPSRRCAASATSRRCSPAA